MPVQWLMAVWNVPGMTIDDSNMCVEMICSLLPGLFCECMCRHQNLCSSHIFASAVLSCMPVLCGAALCMSA